MSNYPTKLDTDAELPRVDDNITEIGAETINSLREAVFAIQQTLGLDPQGAANDLTTRLSRSINDDGTLKTTAFVLTAIVNADVAAGAGIEESKLNLDVATQTLQDQITSNDIDIEALQNSINKVINDLANHVNGSALRHDTYDIDLNSAYPSSTPPEFTGLTSSDLHDALVEMNSRFINHAATTAVGAHQADNISVVNDFSTISATDVQAALEALDTVRARELEHHRDEHHANGFMAWANARDGYSIANQKLPSTLGTFASASIVAGRRNVFEFDGYVLRDLGIVQGDVVVSAGPTVVGAFMVDDVGPRAAVGTKSALLSDQLEIVGTVPDGYAVLAQIYEASSVLTLKKNVAPTIHQSDIRTDSIQLARPNAAGVLSLGINPRFLTNAKILNLEVGVGAGLTRTVAINGLNKDRTGATVSTPTVDTVVERINSVLQNRVDGYAFPAAAYRVGDELMLAHNWEGNTNYSLTVQSGSANYLLGLDGYGADVVGTAIKPTQQAAVYINGKKIGQFKTIVSTTADVAGQVFTFSDVDLLDTGVKVGHLIHMKTHTNTSERGTYFIIGVSETTITIHKNSGITADTNVSVEIVHDALPLQDFSNNTKDTVLEAFITDDGSMGYNERLNYTDNISNLAITNVSDNFLANSLDLTSTVSATEVSLQFGADAKAVTVPTTFSGTVNVFAPSNVEWITVDLTSPVGAGTNTVTIYDHIEEENVLEICSVRLNGLTTLSKLVDKRLFGSIGLDEIREDVIQAHVETPWTELRSDGIVYGFDIFEDGYIEPSSFPNNQGVTVRGGVAYVEGVRCETVTTPVLFPNTAGTYLIVLNKLGNFEQINTSDYSLEEVLDGYAGDYALIAEVVHTGYSLTHEDRRFFINNLDDKVELIIDTTNHRIGNFASIESAIAYANNYPFDEKFLINVVSRTADDLVVPANSREFTIVLDGQINDLLIRSSCKIMAKSKFNRTLAHISGDIDIESTALEVELIGLNVTGTVSATTASSSSYRFINTVFNDTVSLGSGNAGTLLVDGCTANASFTFNPTSFTNVNIENSIFTTGLLTVQSSTITAGSEVCRIAGSIFDTARISSDEAMTHVENCVFRNHSTSSNIVSFNAGTCSVSGTLFDNIALSSTASAIFGVGTQWVSNCVFSNITMGGTGELIELESGDVVDSIFTAVSLSTNALVFCDNFIGNMLVSPTGDALIRCNRSFKDNVSFHAVTGPTSGTEGLRNVSGNTFVGNSTYGYAINLDYPGTYTDPHTIVSGNTFDMNASQPAVLCGASTQRLVFSDNVIDGSSSGIGVALADAAGDINISNNIFTDVIPISASSGQTKLTVSSNRLLGAAMTLQVATTSHVVFTDNYTDANITLSGSSAAYLNISNNVFDGSNLTFSPNLSNSTVSNNVMTSGNLTFNGNLTDTIISGNMGNIVAGSITATGVLLKDNVDITFSTMSNITWSQSVISNNIFDSGSLTFTILTGSAALVSIEGNIFAANVTLNSLGSIDSVDFTGNSSIGSGTITTSANLNNSFITRNTAFAIDVNAGMNNCTIALNNRPSGDIDLQGTINSTSIDGNFCNDLLVNCTSTSGLSITNNVISNTLTVFSIASTLSIANANISNNIVIDDMRFGSADATQTLDGCLIANNQCVDIEFFITDSSSSETVTDNTISGNTINNLYFMGTTQRTFSTATLTNNGVINNQLNGSINVAGDDGLGTVPTYVNLRIAGNNLTSFTAGRGSYLNGAEVSNNTMSNVNLEFADGSGTYDDISVVGNTISTSFFVEIDEGSQVVTNLAINGNTLTGLDLQVYVEQSATNLDLVNLSISGNTLRSIDMQNNATSGTATFDILGATLSDNAFNADSGTSPYSGWSFDKGTQTGAHAIRNVSFANNYVDSDGSDVVRVYFEDNATSSGSLTLTSCSFSYNRDIDFVFNATSTGTGIFTQHCVFSGNAFNGSVSGILNVGASNKFQINSSLITGNTNGQIDFTNAFSCSTVIIDGNRTGLFNLGINSTLQDCVISNNYIGSSATISGGTTTQKNVVLGNVFGSIVTISGISTFTQNNIAHNYFGSPFSLDSLSSACTENTIAHNVAGSSITLPATSSWAANGDNKVVWNHAGSWSVESAGTLDYTDPDRVFFFGNSSDGAGSGTFATTTGGTTARTIVNTNSFTGSITTS